jgi:hypothetical protein
MIILALCIFVFPLTTLAASKNSQSVNIAEAVTVANTQLQPGDYKVEWSGSGPDVQVTFLKNNKPVATAPAKLESQKNPYNGAVETTTEPDNSKALQAIQFKDKSLKFGQGNGSGGE